MAGSITAVDRGTNCAEPTDGAAGTWKMPRSSVDVMPPRCTPLLILLHVLGAAAVSPTPLLSRAQGEFSDFRGKRVSFGSVSNVRTAMPAGTSMAELQAYLTPDRVATAMWDRRRVRRIDDDGRYELTLEPLAFVMLEIETSVLVRVARDPTTEGITLASESFGLSARSPAGKLSTADLNIDVSVAGRLDILSQGRAVGGKVGFETEGDLPPLMWLTPRPLVQAAASGLNRAVMRLVVGEFEQGFVRDFSSWRRQQQQRAASPPPAPPRSQ